jgi:hypothetical protein
MLADILFIYSLDVSFISSLARTVRNAPLATQLLSRMMESAGTTMQTMDDWETHSVRSPVKPWVGSAPEPCNSFAKSLTSSSPHPCTSALLPSPMFTASWPLCSAVIGPASIQLLIFLAMAKLLAASWFFSLGLLSPPGGGQGQILRRMVHRVGIHILPQPDAKF